MSGSDAPVARNGPFWDVLEGRREPPPAAVLLGWELVAIDPDAGTIDLQVQFLSPARPGKLRGTGRVVRRGRDIGFLAGELRNAGGDLVATATATARIRRASNL